VVGCGCGFWAVSCSPGLNIRVGAGQLDPPLGARQRQFHPVGGEFLDCFPTKRGVFGQTLIKDLRIAKELTLRQCCIELKADPSNWSKMERGITPPPKDAKLLEGWAKFFGLAGDQKREFLDLAALARQEIPADMASDETVIAALPAFFRAVRGHELEGDRLLQFVEDLRAVHSPSKANTR